MPRVSSPRADAVLLLFSSGAGSRRKAAAMGER